MSKEAIGFSDRSEVVTTIISLAVKSAVVIGGAVVIAKGIKSASETIMAGFEPHDKLPN